MRSIFLLATLALTPFTSRAADDLIAPGEERFKVNLGAFLVRSDTHVRLDGSVLNQEFSVERALDLDPDRTAVHLSATWRFAPRHRLGLRVFELRRETARTLGTTIELEDNVVSLGTTLSTDNRFRFLGVDYRYSIIRNRRMELAAIGGVLFGRFELQFGATFPRVDVRKSETQPMPIVGAGLDVFLTPRWMASVYAQGISLDVGRTKVNVYSFGLSTETMLTRNIGLGVGYLLDDFDVEHERGDFRGHLGLHDSGIFVYTQARF